MAKSLDLKLLRCKVIKESPLVIWDEREGVWGNLLANLGYIHIDKIDIVDEEGDVVTDWYEKRLESMKEKMLKKYPEEMSKIKTLFDAHQPFSREPLKYDFLPSEINDLLSTLDNHRANGSLDPFYYYLQSAVQAATNHSVMKASVLHNRAELDRQLEEEELKALEIHRQRSDRLIQKQQLKKTADTIDLEAQLNEKLLDELSQENVKRRKLMKQNSQGDNYTPVNEVKGERKSGGLFGVASTLFSAIMISDPDEVAKTNYFIFLEDEVVGKGSRNRSINTENDKVLSKIQSVEQTIQKKEEDVATLKQLIAASSMDFVELNKVEVSTRVKVKAEDVQLVEILVEGKEKSFMWDVGTTVADNIRDLVTAYRDNRDYHHTRARKISAQRVLDKISEISEGGKNAIVDPIKRDVELVKFLRQEKDTFSVFGLNRKASQLHAIYRQAEIQLNNRIKQTIGEVSTEAVVKMHRENTELAKKLDESKLQNQDAFQRMQELEKKQLSNVQPAAASSFDREGADEKSKKLTQQYDQTMKELHAQNAQVFKMSPQEMKVMHFSEDQLVLLDKQREQLSKTLLENQKKLAQAEERLGLLDLDEEQLGVMARIRYLEASQLARKFHLEKEFNKVGNLNGIDPKTLLNSVNTFLLVLVKELDIVLPSRSQSVEPRHGQSPSN
ncbi:MAG: hypothetical protein K2X50_10315 [Gammaproteobacteria bacterium]|nr:hypothetical protein [Gammaproteobacteria bacterium]